MAGLNTSYQKATTVAQQVSVWQQAATNPDTSAGAGRGFVNPANALSAGAGRGFVNPAPASTIQAPPATASVAESTTPTETRGSQTAAPKGLSFPSNIGTLKYFMSLYFFKDHTVSPFAPPKEQATATIHLPMPSSLVERFSMSYNAASLGTVVGGIVESGMAKDIYNIIKNTNSGDINKSIESITGRIGAFKESAGDQGIYTPVVRAIASEISTSAARAFDVVTGTALNPYQSLFFDGPDLRSYGFNLRLSPNSVEESRTLKEIIRVLRERMLPMKKGLIYEYPDSCLITLSAQENYGTLYTMYKSVLKNMSANYAPQGVPAFFAGGESHPVEVELSLEFGEISPITRDIVMGLSTSPLNSEPQKTSTANPKTAVQVSSLPQVSNAPVEGRPRGGQ